MTIQRPLRPYLLCKRVGRVCVSSFFPTDVDGLVAWFSSEYGLYQEKTGASATTPSTNDGDPIGTWAYRTSGEDGYATASSDAARPTLKLAIQNGLDIARFDGTDDALIHTIGDQGDCTIFTVVIMRTESGGSGYRILYSHGSSVNGRMLATNALTGTWGSYSSAVGPQNANTTLADETAYLLTMKCGVTGVDFYLNGSDDGSNAATPIGQTTQHLGGESGQRANVDLCELLVYDSALNDVDREQIETYLNNKWNI